MNGIPESQMSEFAPDVIALIGTGAAKVIPLTQGKVAVVDAEDYEWLSRHKWFAWKARNYTYAGRRLNRHANEKMHRVILKLVDSNVLVDHINGNGLDDRKQNLRIVSRQGNRVNSIKNKNNSSGFKGVQFHSQSGKWRVQIRVNHKLIHCGLFIEKVDAALAYDRAAIKHFKDVAILNFPERRNEYESIPTES